MNKDPLIFINHIMESIKNIESFSEGLTKEKLIKDKLRQSAIVRQIEIMGEAVKNIPIEFTNKYPEISWSEIIRTRDKIIHHYFGVDLNIIWDIIKKDLPDLKKKLKKILEATK
jgi:uncharacterized protein with HEPN domain